MLNPAQYSCKSFETRPWGGFEVVHQDAQCKIKRLYISPNEKTSLQMHQHRCESLLIESGVAVITIAGQENYVFAGKEILIPQKTLHRIENQGPDMLVIFEVQYGAILCENDVIRLEDKYGRV